MAEEGKADWEIRLEKYYEKPVAEAKIDGKLSSSTLQSLLIDIERTVGEAKKFLAANMIPEVRTQLDKIRGLLMAFERNPSGSVEQVASLLKAGVSEKVLKEIYGVTDEEIQRAKKHEIAKKRSPSLHSSSNPQRSAELPQASMSEEKQPLTTEYKLLEYGVL